MGGPVIFFGQRPYNAGRNAARILAVHALNLDKSGNQVVTFVALSSMVTVHHGEGAGMRPAFLIQDTQIIEPPLGGWQVVYPIAGQFAGSTADARR